MNKKVAAIIFVLLLSMVFISGCVGQQTEIKSTEEVANVVTDVSTGIEDVGSTLEDIDQTLGGK